MGQVLEIDALTRRYGRVLAVDGVSFAVAPGSIHGLLGPNGSGKTTTLSCALGLQRASSGTVRVLGEPPARLHRTRGKVGVVFDTSILVRGLTVRRQLAYAASLFGHRPESGRSLADALERTGLADLARRPVTRLSLGQQKRLALACALAGAPELLVLDEPLSGLDPLGARELLRLLRDLAAAGVTVLLSSHRLHEVEPVLTHATILLGGRVARDGPLDELVRAPRRLRIAADEPARAAALLRELGVASCEPTPDGALLVDPGAHTAAALNRRLVEAGLGVEELAPAGTARERGAGALAALFDSLLDEHEAERGGKLA